MSKIREFKTDYVYFDSEKNEYQNVHIIINIGSENFYITLNCDNFLKNSTIEELLNQLNQNAFKRLNISIIDECEIIINAGNKKYKINIQSDDKSVISVTEISLIDNFNQQ